MFFVRKLMTCVQILLIEEKIQLVPPTSWVSDLTSGCGQEGKRKMYFNPHIFCQCFIAAREGYMNAEEPAHKIASKPGQAGKYLIFHYSDVVGLQLDFSTEKASMVKP